MPIDSFALALQHRRNRDALHGVPPYVYVYDMAPLACLISPWQVDGDHTLYTYDLLMAEAPWVDLAHTLDQISRQKVRIDL